MGKRPTRDQFPANAGWLVLRKSVDVGDWLADKPFSTANKFSPAGWIFFSDIMVLTEEIFRHSDLKR